MVIGFHEALAYTKSALEGISDEADSEAKIILSFVTNTEPNRLRIVLPSADTKTIDPIIEKRKEGAPLQYIIGRWWFFGLEFKVGPGVLIPRQDTEILVETALSFAEGKKDLKIADLCSGSGCIAISLAKNLPDTEVTAVEKYDEAFYYLKQNIALNSTENVTPVLADVCDKPFGQYDIIVSNPPYIPVSDREILSREVLNEPEEALFGGDDGLYFYRVITKNWKSSIRSGGKLAFEVGIKEAEAVAELLKKEGFTEIGFACDLLGIQRVVFGTVNDI